MQIIRQGRLPEPINEVTCPVCTTIYSYTIADVKFRDYEPVIECPVCKSAYKKNRLKDVLSELILNTRNTDLKLNKIMATQQQFNGVMGRIDTAINTISQDFKEAVQSVPDFLYEKLLATATKLEGVTTGVGASPVSDPAGTGATDTIPVTAGANQPAPATPITAPAPAPDVSIPLTEVTEATA